ncbi:MAG: hypothetical protein IKR48_07200 [Kiritimatiellae bacterium]|nr:hypothetical protein [Kiritimatiellia bacterium]
MLKKVVSWGRAHPGIAAFLLFFLSFAVVMAAIFYPVWPLNLVTLSPDAPSFYASWFRWESLERMLCMSDAMIFPDRVRQLIFPPLWWQEMTYILPCFLAALAVCFYLRTQGLSRFASYSGGFLFALSGYSFTLLNAGHVGYFILISYTLFGFALIDRCFRVGKWFYFAMLGACVIWGEMNQPDIWMLFASCLIGFALWRSWCVYRETHSWSFLWKTYPKFLVSLVVLLLIGWGSIQYAFNDALVSRQKQMGLNSSAPNVEQTSEQKEAEKQKRWRFTTNWSMPPEDFLETLVPGVFGDENTASKYPYWGRLGAERQFRQHTLYVGLVSVLFALFAIFWGGARWRRRSEAAMPVDETYRTTDIPFWTVVLLVTALCAMGRYCPFYKLIYHLPFVDSLRAPVKFFHLFELAVACLSGFAIQRLLSHPEKIRKFRWLAVGFTVFLLIGILVCTTCSDSTIAHIQAMFQNNHAAGVALYQYQQSNFLCAFFLSLLVTGLLFLVTARFFPARFIRPVVVLIVAIGICNLAVIGRRYILPRDVGRLNNPNLLTQTLEKATQGKPALLFNAVEGKTWLDTNLPLFGFPSVQSRMGQGEMTKLLRSCKNDWGRFMQKSGARFAILPISYVRQIPSFQQQRVFRNLLYFTLSESGVSSIPLQSNGLALLEYLGTFDPPFLSPARTRKDSISIRGTVNASAETLVRLTDPYDETSVFTVDGNPTKQESVCGCAAVRVQPGKHQICYARPIRAANVVSIAATLCILAWGLWFVLPITPGRQRRQ